MRAGRGRRGGGRLAHAAFLERIERAESERAFVEWQVDRLSDGRFEVRNIGAGVAHEVSVEAWTPDELGTTTGDAVRPQSQSNDVVLVELPCRERAGPGNLSSLGLHEDLVGICRRPQS